VADLTLLEAAKQMEPSRMRGIIQLYADAYQPMQVAPVINTGGKAAYQWTIEDELAHSSGGKRNVGSDFTASYGKVKPYESDCKIYGGKISADRYIKHHSPASVAFQESSQVRSHAREFAVDVFEASGGTSLRGINHWVSNDSAYTGQVVSAGATENGVLPTTTMLDELMSKVDIGPNTFFYMPDVGVRRYQYIGKGQQSNEPAVRFAPDQFGVWQNTYNGVPIINLKDGKGTDLLSTTELDSTSANSSTYNIYLVSWGVEQASLFSSNEVMNGVPVPQIIPATDGSNLVYETLEYYVGFVPHRPRCVGVLKHCKNSVTS